MKIYCNLSGYLIVFFFFLFSTLTFFISFYCTNFSENSLPFVHHHQDEQPAILPVVTFLFLPHAAVGHAVQTQPSDPSSPLCPSYDEYHILCVQQLGTTYYTNCSLFSRCRVACFTMQFRGVVWESALGIIACF